jgi:chemotaxis response regulator CheB
MANRTREESKEIAEVTRNLSALSLDLAEEGRAAIMASRGKVERSRELLRASEPGALLPAPSDLTPEPAESVNELKTIVPAQVVVVGGSAGSSVPLRKILSSLPRGFSAAILIVQHTSPTGWAARSTVDLLQGITDLPACVAMDMRPIESGRIYVCPPNHHLSLENGLMRLDMSPVENHTRPSIDVLFRSAAASFGRRVAAVLLSGMLTDGTAGVWQIKRRGGTVIVQDPAEAEYPNMPRNALENVIVDYVLSANQIGHTLIELCAVRPQGRDSAGRPSILIVEDEVLVAENLRERLEGLAYEVCGSVASGEEAVALAAEASPDLILMDIRLSGKMDGIEAARQIWERFQIPVIFVTAHADLQTLAGVKNTANYGYLVKPIQTASVRAAIELGLDRRQKESRFF